MDWDLHFTPLDNKRTFCYSKQTEGLVHIILTMVNQNPYHRESGGPEPPLEFLGAESHQPFQVDNILTGFRYLWHGNRNYVEISSDTVSAHIDRIDRPTRTERDSGCFI